MAELLKTNMYVDIHYSIEEGSSSMHYSIHVYHRRWIKTEGKASILPSSLYSLHPFLLKIILVVKIYR